ncbi:MAG TPA: hypothetical protein VLB80_04000 [Candidatus Babeliales bacterium]|nr:hypothetical protein [Candidatus Babeliales bacterium]
MNKYIKKQTFFIVIMTIAISVPLCGTVDIFKEKLYKFIENPLTYNAGVYMIDKTAKLISNIIIRLAPCIVYKNETNAYKQNRFQWYSKIIDHRLSQIEENLKYDEINTINAIYKEFNVTSKDQQTINSILGQYKEMQKQYLFLPHKKEGTMLKFTSPEILSFCKQININPTAFELRISNDSNSPFVATATGLGVNYQFNNNTLIINDIVHCPVITLYPKFYELLYEDQVAVIGHELTHLILQHQTIANILLMEIKYFTEIKAEEVMISKIWKNLEIIYEQQAEILHKDAEWALKMRNKRNKFYYADHLFLKHYAQLTEIDELHTLKRTLKKYENSIMQS